MWVPRKCVNNMITRKKENIDLETLLVVGLKLVGPNDTRETS
jgi:hypothetical protein